MKKVIIYILLAVIILVVGRQLHWLIKESGNVIVYVTNSSHQDEVEIEVNIDGKKFDVDTYTNQYLWYKKFSKFESLGNHTIEVKVKEKDISQTKEFFVLGAKWINIEFFNEVVDDSYGLQISVESSPVKLNAVTGKVLLVTFA